ncbi:hypothetical protein [Massilia sp. NP310]|uniref:hypothetical protein n=1 Tax=Massilia sp. NP310 TaxID=2861282 RepID=UPI001C6252C8|nr:hypothetical protein [Massilia sp. NP310]QYG01887.1 hypothetical protein KY496_00015 [Massilia sp. NP310]
MSLYDTVLQAGTMLDIGADGFAAQLNSFVVDIGKVSLKGLSDDEIQKELEAVFSKVGDDLAKFGVGGLEQFQKVGEGYLETLTRVATNYQAVSVVTDSLGMTFGSLGLASVGARERLIDLVGGLDESPRARTSSCRTSTPTRSGPTRCARGSRRRWTSSESRPAPPTRCSSSAAWSPDWT